jgi:hypothetical protein
MGKVLAASDESKRCLKFKRAFGKEITKLWKRIDEVERLMWNLEALVIDFVRAENEYAKKD